MSANNGYRSQYTPTNMAMGIDYRNIGYVRNCWYTVIKCHNLKTQAKKTK